MMEKNVLVYVSNGFMEQPINDPGFPRDEMTFKEYDDLFSAEYAGGYHEYMGLILGKTNGDQYIVTKLIPVKKFMKGTKREYLIPSKTEMAMLIEKYLASDEIALGFYHCHSHERLLSNQRPGPSKEDMISKGLKTPGYESRIAENPLGIVIEPEFDNSISGDQLENYDPRNSRVLLYAYLTRGLAKEDLRMHVLNPQGIPLSTVFRGIESALNKLRVPVRNLSEKSAFAVSESL